MDATKFLVNGVYFNLPSGSGGSGGSPKYLHFIHLSFTDGCAGDYTIDGYVVIETSDNTELTTTTFKALFDSETISVSSTDYKVLSLPASQYFKQEYGNLKACCYKYNEDDDYFDTEHTDEYSGALTLDSLTDTVVSSGGSSGSGSSGGTALYNHSIKARFINNCYEEFDVIIKFQSSDDTQITTEAGFKALFSESISTDSENDNYNYRIIPFLNSTYIVDTTYQFGSGTINQTVLGYDTVNDCFTYKDDYNGPSTFVTITDTVTSV